MPEPLHPGLFAWIERSFFDSWTLGEVYHHFLAPSLGTLDFLHRPRRGLPGWPSESAPEDRKHNIGAVGELLIENSLGTSASLRVRVRAPVHEFHSGFIALAMLYIPIVDRIRDQRLFFNYV